MATFAAACASAPTSARPRSSPMLWGNAEDATTSAMACLMGADGTPCCAANCDAAPVIARAMASRCVRSMVGAPGSKVEVDVAPVPWSRARAVANRCAACRTWSTRSRSRRAAAGRTACQASASRPSVIPGASRRASRRNRRNSGRRSKRAGRMALPPDNRVRHGRPRVARGVGREHGPADLTRRRSRRRGWLIRHGLRRRPEQRLHAGNEFVAIGCDPHGPAPFALKDVQTIQVLTVEFQDLLPYIVLLAHIAVVHALGDLAGVEDQFLVAHIIRFPQRPTEDPDFFRCRIPPCGGGFALLLDGQQLSRQVRRRGQLELPSPAAEYVQVGLGLSLCLAGCRGLLAQSEKALVALAAVQPARNLLHQLRTNF